MGLEVFLDTVYAVALTAIKDELHDKALEIAQKLKADKTRLVTTHAILLEIGNALSRQRYRSGSIRLLSSLERDPSVEIVPINHNLYTDAFELYKIRSDKEWGLIDCLSFVVMRRRGIREALTSDRHFEQAGFQILL